LVNKMPEGPSECQVVYYQTSMDPSGQTLSLFQTTYTFVA
jgi:hypothetical protein